MYKIILMRHGESIWNKENKFTGWTDIDLSEKGYQDSILAGRKLLEHSLTFNIAYTSVLKRAIKTLFNLLEIMDLLWIPVIKSWRLNERHYGALQGLNKLETAQKYGKDKVQMWRRSYDVTPMQLTKGDSRYPGKDIKYTNIPREQLPLTECLKDTVKRVIPFWQKEITPNIKEGKKIIIVAHGNSLRALIKYLENISDDEIINLNIPTATPIVCNLDNNLKLINRYII
ncbi:MAG: 2,3-diphosphoglycerate-dependent phosphoglycerate mutase [Endomicrobium sp.]|jgi:2,3-bisphosphoglycerate-dependent phosphoglycerate mutase|nr:2,3-diphosphoglycerate-dependent phosphoglycerate mutase [Endomicrobium sp.]